MPVFNIFTRFREWLFLKAAALFVAQADVDIDIQMADAKARLLSRAAELDREDTPGFEDIAAELRAAAERLGSDPTNAAARITHALEHEAVAGFQAPEATPALPKPTKRRGRPPKQAAPPTE